MQNVLIVDDNALFRKLLKENLHFQFPSLIILEAKNGEEALEMAQTSRPDLIFMDIRLPDGNGLELTTRIKMLNPDVKVVILTSYDEPEYRDAAFGSKADHYASKGTFMPMLNVILQGSNSE